MICKEEPEPGDKWWSFFSAFKIQVYLQDDTIELF